MCFHSLCLCFVGNYKLLYLFFLYIMFGSAAHCCIEGLFAYWKHCSLLWLHTYRCWFFCFFMAYTAKRYRFYQCRIELHSIIHRYIITLFLSFHQYKYKPTHIQSINTKDLIIFFNLAILLVFLCRNHC